MSDQIPDPSAPAPTDESESESPHSEVDDPQAPSGPTDDRVRDDSSLAQEPSETSNEGLANPGAPHDPNDPTG